MKSLRRYGAVVGAWMLCVAAACLVLVYGNHQERAASLRSFSELAGTGSSFVSAYVDDVFESERRLAPQVTTAADSAGVLASTASLMGYPNALLLDRRGRAVAVAPESPGVLGVDLAARYRHLNSALQGRQAVSDVVTGAADGTPVVGFAMPLFESSYGVLSIGQRVNDSRLAGFVEHQLPDGHRAYLFDSKGTEIVRANAGAGADRVSPGDLQIAVRAAAHPGLTLVGERVLAASSVEGTPWMYVLDASSASVLTAGASGNNSEWTLLIAFAGISLAGLMFTTRAIASRAHTRREKTEADQRFHLTVQHAPVGMAVLDLDYRFVEPNTRLCQMLGYTSAELETMTVAEVGHPDDPDLIGDSVAGLLNGERDTFELEKRFRRRDGSTLWGRMTVSMVRGASGQPRYFVGQIEDVTEVRAAQAELEMRARLRPADRPRQPRSPRRPPQRRARVRSGHRCSRLLRPGPFQAGQRHRRAPHRRQGPGHGGHPAPVLRAPRRHGRPNRR